MRRFSKVHMMIALVALVPALSALMAGPVSANPPLVCTTSIAVPVDDDVLVPNSATCTITSTGSVNGKILVGTGGITLTTILIVEGTVNGDIMVDGSRAIGRVLFGGSVNGNIEAQSLIQIGSSAFINGNLISGPGADCSDILVDVCIQFFDDGGGGGAIINGNIELEGSGDADITDGPAPSISSDIKCNGLGSDSNIPLSAVSGNKDGCFTQ